MPGSLSRPRLIVTALPKRRSSVARAGTTAYIRSPQPPMRPTVSRALSGLHGGGAGSDGMARTSSLRSSCEAQWAE
ncbi:hypothetical protein MOX02_05120 [Methylobacterium oxalidis]|uniref:Uncharacterized protein n=1 Tax=Methylobacterium oxalidis TaxID=944322 RepID=A0A512IXN2_9HYPH|nr:hypothetical protein MOX02_05120 [Methylobacterium oxalidis]